MLKLLNELSTISLFENQTHEFLKPLRVAFTNESKSERGRRLLVHIFLLSLHIAHFPSPKQLFRVHVEKNSYTSIISLYNFSKAFKTL